MINNLDLAHIDQHLRPIMPSLLMRRYFVTGKHSWFGRWITGWMEHAGLEYEYWRKPYTLFPSGDFDTIIHLAVCPIEPVIEFAQQFKSTILFTSTGGVYDPQPQESSMLKVRDEMILTMSDLDYRIARCFSFIGQGIDDDLAAGKFIHQAIKSEPLTVWGNGMTQRSYMYMADLVIWLFIILAKGEREVYDVGSGKTINMRQLSNFIAGETNGEVVYIDRPTVERNPVYVPDGDGYERSLGLGLKTWVGWKEAIKRTIADEMQSL